MTSILKNRVLLYFVVALLVRLLFVLIIQNYHIAFYSDFGNIAINILSGNGYSMSPGYYWHAYTQPTAMQLPLYTYFTTFFYWVFGVASNAAHLSMQITQCVLSAATVIPLLKIFRNKKNHSLLHLVGVLYSLYFPSIMLCLKLSSSVFAMFFIAWVLYLTLLLYDHYSPKIFTALGVVWGLTLLTNPVFVPYALFSFLPLLWKAFQEGRLQKYLMQISKVAIISMLILYPWVLRNYLVFNKVVPFTTTWGLNFFIGNNALSTGEQYPKFIPYPSLLRNKEVLEKYPQIKAMSSLRNESEVSAAFEEIALDFIKQHPRQFLSLLGRKFLYFWSFSPSHHATSTLVGRAYIGMFFSLLLCFCYGSYKVLKNKKSPFRLLLFQILLIMLSTSFVYSVASIGMVRYRIQIEHLMLLISVIGVYHFGIHCIHRRCDDRQAC